MFKNLKKSKSGAAAIGFAIILPVLLFLVIGGIELSLHMLKDASMQRAVSNISIAVQKDPAGVKHDDALAAGNVLANFSDKGNFFCAQAGATPTAASCSGTTWNTARPAGVAAGEAYYVTFRTRLESSSITPLMSSYIKPLNEVAVVRISDAVPPGTLQGWCRQSWGGKTQAGTAPISPAYFDFGTVKCGSPNQAPLPNPCRVGCSCPSGYKQVMLGSCHSCTSAGGVTGWYQYSCLKL